MTLFIREGKHILKLFLDINPNKRISGHKALNHPWITKNALDPLPINFYQSLIQKSINKKMMQAITAVVFCNYFSKHNENKKKIETECKKKKNDTGNYNAHVLSNNNEMKNTSFIMNDIEETKQISPMQKKQKLVVIKRKHSNIPLFKHKDKDYEPSLTQGPINNGLHKHYQSQKKIKLFQTIDIENKIQNDKPIFSSSPSITKAKKNSTDRLMFKTKRRSALSPLKVSPPKIARETIMPITTREIENNKIKEENEKGHQCHSSRNYSMLLPFKHDSDNKIYGKVSSVIRELNLVKLLKSNDSNVKMPLKRNIIKFNHYNNNKLKLYHLCLPHIKTVSPLVI